MTKIDDSTLHEMQVLLAGGSTYAEIAAKYRFGYGTVYNRLRRAGSEFIARTLIDPNKSSPKRVTRLVLFNGGCSSRSGVVPVTLPRVTCIDGTAAA